MVATKYAYGTEAVAVKSVTNVLTTLADADSTRTHLTLINESDEVIDVSFGDNTLTWGAGVPITPGQIFEVKLHTHYRGIVYGISNNAGGVNMRVVENIAGYTSSSRIGIAPGTSLIGAVNIQDADTTDRAKVRDGDVAGVADDHVIVVQHQAATGETLPSGVDATEPITTASMVQDADTTDRAKVRDGDVAGAADDHVLVVQHQGPTGESQPSGADAADPINTASMIQDADTTDRAKVRDGDVAGAADDHVLVVQHQGPTGESQPSGSDAADPIFTTTAGNISPALLGAIGAHFSPTHFTATYAAATQLTLAGLDYALDVSQFLGIIRMDNSGNSTLITPDDSTYQFAWANPTLTVTGATFAATDEFIVVVAPTVPSALNMTSDAWEVLVNNWPVDSKSHAIHEDTTDLAADTYYYPSSDGLETVGYRCGTLQFKLIDAEMVVQGKNHEDLDWEDVTTMSVKHGVGVPVVPPMTIGAAGVTVNGVLDFQHVALDMYRVKVVTYDATNTVQLNWRQRA
jgi:hypothetical protein